MTKVFIDGSAGTTGLRIKDRLTERKDIELIALPEEERKNPGARKQAIGESDITFLCLPDAAAIEAVSLAQGSKARIIDTSTAHRTAPRWDYGFAELTGLREKIAVSSRVANPGCHASGFISLVAPLVEAGIVSPSVSLSCFSLTGYSGGGKKMIADYEADGRNILMDSPALYALGQSHKHLPEMKKYCRLENEPVFSPIVAPYYSGMQVSVPLFAKDCKTDIDGIKSFYKEYYGKGGLIEYSDDDCEGGLLYSSSLSGKDTMAVTVTGNAERMVLVSRFDNLGKGASGAAIQNMNIMLGIDEKTGLVTKG